ncbi:3-hydroxyacyl-CoA dehydrogenase NAD-binding domain-containing protein [Singulisphaera sp. PoT]|uniref:3-hydroxyacyl-CoA dehydrogenase NAD-binding domain-containing protein n=1 Tax=Singulisphaera sp. PoT TaxID=3411797 RepID=UPI003BF5D811
MSDAFQLEERDDKIALLTLDLPGKKVNTLSRGVLAELARFVAQLESRTDLRGLLFRSGKRGQFIAGADLNELGALAYSPREHIEQAIDFGHQLFTKVSRLPFPTVALIDGNCMGGGTELVVSMDDRIASDSPETKIACPETKLGLIPAWGGTQRLPRLMGLNAIEFVCGGEPVNARKAVELGLAFDAVPVDKLIEDGVRRIEYLRDSGVWVKRREKLSGRLKLRLDQQMFAFSVAKGQIAGKTKGQYPAPLAALEAIQKGSSLPLDQGLDVEKQVALTVMGTPIAANLIAVFFMKNRLDRDSGVDRTDVTPRKVERVGVIGAGLMGSGIAAAHARSGIPAAIVDVDDARLAAGMQRAQDVVASRIKIGRATPKDMADMLSRLSTATSPGILADRDVVIEAITEDESAKKATYEQLKGVLRDGAILASNTSTISITRMAESVPHPDRFIGMHFFNPVDRMELVEVVRGEKTSDDTVATIVALAKRIRKTPIVVKDCAGFLVNRVLFPYMNEALILLQEGVPMDAIDAAATKFGMPMGPIALQDLVGIDTSFYAGSVLAAAYPDRASAPGLLKDLLKAGRLGQKSGSGFRKHGGKKPVADPAFDTLLAKHRVENSGTSTSPEEIVDRLIFPMLLEATRVLEEGVVREPADVDMGVILGIGFPPFRGGILRWADAEGAERIVDRLERFASLGKRFEPTQTLLQHAQQGTTFYPTPKGIAAPRMVTA